MIQQFRTAMFGFNRRDVQQYVEQIAGAHRKEQDRLQERLDQLQEQLTRAEERVGELETALSGAESEKSGAAEEEAKVRASLEESTRTLTRLRGELSQTESKLVVARKELERMKEQVGALEPMAENYAQLKERVATVELDAHRKAQTTVDEARTEAERIRADVRMWLDRVLEQYGRLRQGMDALLAQTRDFERLDETARSLRELAEPEQAQNDT